MNSNLVTNSVTINLNWLLLISGGFGGRGRGPNQGGRGQMGPNRGGPRRK